MLHHLAAKSFKKAMTAERDPMDAYERTSLNLFMKKGIRLGLAGLAVLLAFRADRCAGGEEVTGEQPAIQPRNATEPCAMSVIVNEGLFQVEAGRCRLKQVLTEIALAGKVEMSIDPSLEDSVITVSLRERNLEDAIGTIIDLTGQKNIAVEYESADAQGSERRARKVYLVRRATGNDGPRTGSKLDGDLAPGNVIKYADHRLTVKVEKMDVMELLRAIEEEINRVPKKVPFRILVEDKIEGTVSIDIARMFDDDALDIIVRLLRPRSYSGKYYSSYSVTDGETKKVVVAYVIKRMSQEEGQERDRKIRELLETGKRLSEMGAYGEAQTKFGGAYLLDKFNADVDFFVGLNDLRRGAPAVNSFKRALEKEPSYADAYYWLGVSYEKDGNIWEAVKSYREYVAKGKDETLLKKASGRIIEVDSTEAKFCRKELSIAENYELNNGLEMAVEVYKKLIARDSSCREAHRRLAIVYLRQHNIDAAHDVVQRLSDGPEKFNLLFTVGIAQRQRDPAKSKSILEDLSGRNPGKDIETEIRKALKDLE